MKMRGQKRAAFTLLEIATVVVIIGILIALLFPILSKLRSRAQRAQCTANLHSLYIASESYLQQNGSWPQISRSDADTGSEDFANAWVAALAPFGATRQTWICPTIQELLQSPDYNSPENARLDYVPMPFDDKTFTPHRWARQPWFVETGDVHGTGNLVIFTDGSVSDLSSITSGLTPGPLPQ